MSGNRSARLVLSLVTVLAILAGGCAQAPAEQRLRERIAEMEAALEDRDASAFMEGVAANFIGEGGLDRQRLRGLLAAQMMRNAEIEAVLGPVTIELHDDHAQVTFEAVVTGGEGGLLPQRAQAYAVESGWRDADDGWQVVEARWSPRF